MRYIKITEDIQQKAVLDFTSYIAKALTVDGKFTYSMPKPPKPENKINIVFKQKAWAKMIGLVQEFQSEVGWNGVVEKREDAYYITDIVVYPQEVTSATVNVDTSKYGMWRANLPEETYNAIRFQGHSHVNMGVSPSSTDVDYQNNILNSLEDGDFYIFMIINKSRDIWVALFDKENNVVFEKEDITVEYESSFVDEFVDEAKSLVTKKIYTPTYSNNWGKNTYSTGKTAGKKKEKKKDPVDDLYDEDGNYDWDSYFESIYGYNPYKDMNFGR